MGPLIGSPDVMIIRIADARDRAVEVVPERLLQSICAGAANAAGSAETAG